MVSLSPENVQEATHKFVTTREKELSVVSVVDDEQIQLTEPRQMIVKEVRVETHSENKPQSDNTAVKDNKMHYSYLPYHLLTLLQIIIQRHISQVHAEEIEVKPVVDLGSKHPERLIILAVLGGKIFDARTTFPSKLILPRRKATVNLTEYLKCYLCGNTLV